MTADTEQASTRQGLAGPGELAAILDLRRHPLRRAAFLAILDGRAEPLVDLVLAAGATPAEAEQLAQAGLIVLDAERRVVGSLGLSLVPVRQHRLALRGRRFWTWCAVDAAGIPAGLREDAVAETTCHTCGTPVRLVFERGRLVHASHPAARLWCAERVPGRSLVGGTCGLMNLFCTPEHLDDWLAARPDERGRALDLAGVAERGRETWAAALAGRDGSPAACCPTGEDPSGRSEKTPC